MFSLDKVDDSDVIYHPPGYGGKDYFENIRVKSGFKGLQETLLTHLASDLLTRAQTNLDCQGSNIH